MKRTFPLLITAVTGFILIVAYFIPSTQGWGEVTAIWFDILAAIAMILGGGNLLKIHLKKISDRPAGWGYSVVTLAAFLVTLGVGLSKWGVPPAVKQESYGETFVSVPLEDFPVQNLVDLAISPSFSKQLEEENGQIYFRGWMTPGQKQKLIEQAPRLQWQCDVESLYARTQPPGELKGRVRYLIDHQVLAFKGHMTEEQRLCLDGLAAADNKAWHDAVEELYKRAKLPAEVSVDAENVPEGVTPPWVARISKDKSIQFDDKTLILSIEGPMSTDQRDKLADDQLPRARPLSPDRRDALLKELTDRGPLNEKQTEAFDTVLNAIWKVEHLHKALDQAGKAGQVEKTACEMLAEQEAGEVDIKPKKRVGEDQGLNEIQVVLLHLFAENEDWPVEMLNALLIAAGPFNDKQTAALTAFYRKSQTLGRRNFELWKEMSKAGALTGDQQEFLLADYRRDIAWKKKAGELFAAAHTVKFPWSGTYNATGAPFWWLYEYAFKPLTATMFAMLAFYVASAAFRAFRAKNLEATLLLGTAFVILLGQTFAGVYLTSWLPETSPLRIENLSVWIMSVFNTAGTRAIMIGIALGIASTSLKVLLGIDRSYLGSGEE